MILKEIRLLAQATSKYIPNEDVKMYLIGSRALMEYAKQNRLKYPRKETKDTDFYSEDFGKKIGIDNLLNLARELYPDVNPHKYLFENPSGYQIWIKDDSTVTQKEESYKLTISIDYLVIDLITESSTDFKHNFSQLFNSGEELYSYKNVSIILPSLGSLLLSKLDAFCERRKKNDAIGLKFMLTKLGEKERLFNLDKEEIPFLSESIKCLRTLDSFTLNMLGLKSIKKLSMLSNSTEKEVLEVCH